MFNSLRIFFKTGKWPKWEQVNSNYRWIIHKEMSTYYELIQQALFINVNDKTAEPEWEIAYYSAYSCSVPTKRIVKKKDVTCHIVNKKITRITFNQ